MIWRFKRKLKPENPGRVDTEVLVAMRAARTLLHMHLGATFALSVAAIICILGLAGATYILATQSVDHVLRVNGVLQAVEQSTPVTHDTGGIVSNVFVTEGEIVAEGQILMSLDASDIENGHAEAQRAVARLILQSQCLKAERDKNTQVLVPADLKVALGRLNQLEEMRRSVRDCRGNLRKAALRRMADHGERVALENQIHLYSRLSHTGQSLRGRLHQLGEEVQELELQKTLNLQNLIGTLKNLIKLDDLRNQLAKMLMLQQETEITKTQQINRQLDNIIDALALAEQQLARLDRIKRNRYIYASNSGRVQRLRIKQGGKRIARGAYIMEISPLTTNFEVLATVNVSDLSYVRVGQNVTVSLSSGLPRAVAVPATVVRIAKATENTRTLSIAIQREDLNKRDLLVGDRSLNGLGERSEALIAVQSKNALETLKEILRSNFPGTET